MTASTFVGIIEPAGEPNDRRTLCSRIGRTSPPPKSTMVARLSLLHCFWHSQSRLHRIIPRQVLRELGCHRDFSITRTSLRKLHRLPRITITALALDASHTILH